MLFLPIDPMKVLYWSAVLNGVIAVPLMVASRSWLPKSWLVKT